MGKGNSDRREKGRQGTRTQGRKEKEHNEKGHKGNGHKGKWEPEQIGTSARGKKGKGEQ